MKGSRLPGPGEELPFGGDGTIRRGKRDGEYTTHRPDGSVSSYIFTRIYDDEADRSARLSAWGLR